MNADNIMVSKSDTIVPNLIRPDQEYMIRIHGTVIDNITPVEIRQLRDLIDILLDCHADVKM